MELRILAFGGDELNIMQYLAHFEVDQNIVDYLPNSDLTLIDWVTKFDEPDVIIYFFEPESADLAEDLVALTDVRMQLPQMRIICVSPGVMHSTRLGPIYMMGIPIMILDVTDDGQAEILALATTKWPGFSLNRGFTPAIVRGLPDTQV